MRDKKRQAPHLGAGGRMSPAAVPLLHANVRSRSTCHCPRSGGAVTHSMGLPNASQLRRAGPGGFPKRADSTGTSREAVDTTWSDPSNCGPT
jgi:hypothetical protein